MIKVSTPLLGLILAPALILLAGCGTTANSTGTSNASFSILPGASMIDTNCTGCNTTNSAGMAVEQFAATLNSGGSANVTWSVSGGDAKSGSGSISTTGQYTPPSYLTADRVQVTISAALNSNPNSIATTVLTITPGFLQPLTPENAALSNGGNVTITGYLAEAGGSTGISFALASSATGSGSGLGSLGSTSCQRNNSAFTYCTVTYSAPANVTVTNPTYIVATVGSSSSKTSTVVLLNNSGIASNPAIHQPQMSTPVALGASGGNNGDSDSSGDHVTDCCGGTLGALIQDNTGRQYILSNNHVLARSDHANAGDIIIQPGLIDNNCTPYGSGSGTTQVGTLTGWLPLSSNQTNVDAAIAAINTRNVRSTGDILELGARQSNGTLAAAPPGISSSGGKGEQASVGMVIAKSGRTTGLTCASVSAINLDVLVDYYSDCAETKHYLTKTFTNQIAISGNKFSDAGDSGSLIVDTQNAEPIGLFFAGGLDSSGVSHGVANPAPEILRELGAQLSGGTNYSFVGTEDHPVSCLNYGDNTVSTAQAISLTSAETNRAQEALSQARTLVNRTTGILGVAIGKSSDHPGEGAVILYVDENANVNAPATIDGVRTVVIPTTAATLQYRTAPLDAWETRTISTISVAVFSQAFAAKQQIAHLLLSNNSSYFGVGVGQSMDNPREAALVVFVDRKHIPTRMPVTMNGMRVRYIVMDRLHVTRSYSTASTFPNTRRCMPHNPVPESQFNFLNILKPHSLNF